MSVSLSYQEFWLFIFLSCCIGSLIGLVISWYIIKRLWAATLKEYEIDCPFDFEWKFSKADLILAMRTSVDGYLQGRCFYPFNIPGLQCHLKIFPNGDAVNHRGQTGIFLNVNGSKERKIAAEFKISVESAKFSKSVNHVYDEYYGYGSNICKTTKFFDWKSKYFVNEEITIKVKGILKAQRPSISTIPSPISFKWKIKEDDLRKAMASDSRKTLRSTVFNTTASIDDLRYFFTIYPNKFNVRENKVGASVYLNVELKKEKKAKAVFDFSIDSASFRSLYEHVFESDHGYGGFICSTEDLFDPSKGFIVDGCFTINFNGVLLVERNPRMNMKCKNGFISRSYQHDAKDFMIIIGDNKIPVHKQLLMDVSPVWAGMFGSGMNESTENEMKIKDFPFEIVEAAIKLLYNQNGFCTLTIEEMFLLRNFANKYFIESLIELVERALIKMISPSNVCQLIHLSAPESFNAPKLRESCIEFLAKCFNKKIPVYGAESLGDKFLASIFLRGLCQISDSVTHL